MGSPPGPVMHGPFLLGIVNYLSWKMHGCIRLNTPQTYEMDGMDLVLELLQRAGALSNVQSKSHSDTTEEL